MQGLVDRGAAQTQQHAQLRFVERLAGAEFARHDAALDLAVGKLAQGSALGGVRGGFGGERHGRFSGNKLDRTRHETVLCFVKVE